MEQAGRNSPSLVDELCDAFNQIGDFSYAILPKDIAHGVGDLKKAVLSNLRGAIDWEINWIDDRVAAGDKLREEWRAKCHRPENQNVSY